MLTQTTLAQTTLDINGSIDCFAPELFPAATPSPATLRWTSSDEFATLATPTSHEVLYGSLNDNDDANPLRARTYKDDYGFTMDRSGQAKFNLDSNQFDTYIQVIDFNTGRLLASNDDFGAGTDSQVTLTLQAGSEIVLRVTSAYRYSTGSYRLTADTFDSPAPVPPVTAPAPRPGEIPFSSEYGYGVVDAAVAVARAIGQPAFTEVPNLGGNNWGNDFVNAPTVWTKGYTGQNIIVAVIDSGVDYTHADLGNNIWRNSAEVFGNGIDDDRNGYIDDIVGWDFVDNENDPMDENSHGTHVAGIIAAQNNGFGVTGVAYNAQIMPVRVLGADGKGGWPGISQGIHYAADNGAKVINMSLGGEYSQEIIDAVRYASQKGVVVVMSSGNNGQDQPSSPAIIATEVGIAVGAIDRNVQVADFSNRAGSNPAIRYLVAPGVDILSTVPGDYDFKNGTSMAAPYVAGVVALMLSANPNLTTVQVQQILIETAYRGETEPAAQSWEEAMN
jgi:subtilisin family serine protease